MKKKILSWILTAAILCTILPEGIYATELPVETTAVEVVETQSMEAENTRTGALGGLEKAELIEVEDAEFVASTYDPIDATGSAQYNSEWDIYSTNYYYNQLSSNKKALWDALDAMCLQYLTGTADAAGRYSAYYYTATVNFTNMESDEAGDVALMFKYSNPQYYFLDLPILFSRSSNSIALTIYPGFANGTTRAAETAKFKAAIDEVVAQMQTLPTALEKELYAHDWICQNVRYGLYTNYHQVAYSVFVEKNYTVCAGYAQAFQLLCNAVGIDAAVQTSMPDDGEGHEWNIVKLDNNWYYVDCTWDDLDYYSMPQMYTYFNRSFEMLRSADLEQGDSHKPETMWEGYLPISIYDSGATYSSIGTIAATAGQAAMPGIIQNGNQVVIAVPEGTTVYYTTDGSTPSAAYTRAVKYTGPFTPTTSCTINAVAVQSGMTDSAVASQYISVKYNLTLNANGGYISKKSNKKAQKTVTNGATYGNLKNPKRSGYAFTGWYTKKSGGTKITSTSQVTITKNTTLYAHWSKIKAKKANISKLSSPSAGSITVRIKNISSATGYQIRYSLKSSMASSKKKTTEENQRTISGLKKGKTYYVQVRMYQKESVSGKKVYGPWSSTKKIKTKK